MAPCHVRLCAGCSALTLPPFQGPPSDPTTCSRSLPRVRRGGGSAGPPFWGSLSTCSRNWVGWGAVQAGPGAAGSGGGPPPPDSRAPCAQAGAAQLTSRSDSSPAEGSFRQPSLLRGGAEALHAVPHFSPPPNEPDTPTPLVPHREAGKESLLRVVPLTGLGNGLCSWPPPKATPQVDVLDCPVGVRPTGSPLPRAHTQPCLGSPPLSHCLCVGGGGSWSCVAGRSPFLPPCVTPPGLTAPSSLRLQA